VERLAAPQEALVVLPGFSTPFRLGLGLAVVVAAVQHQQAPLRAARVVGRLSVVEVVAGAGQAVCLALVDVEATAATA
jgi:hypothetical protein